MKDLPFELCFRMMGLCFSPAPVSIANVRDHVKNSEDYLTVEYLGIWSISFSKVLVAIPTLFFIRIQFLSPGDEVSFS